MSKDLTGNRELVWLIRLRQGPLFPAETLSVEFVGKYEGVWTPTAEREVTDVENYAGDLWDALRRTSPPRETPK